MDMQYERETVFLEKISVKGYKKLKTDLVLIYIRVMLIGVQVEQHKWCNKFKLITLQNKCKKT